MSDFSGMLRDIAEDICAGRIKWWNDPVWIKTLKDSADRLTHLESENAKLRDVLAAARDVDNDDKTHWDDMSSAKRRMHEAIRAADQSSAVGEKDGGGE